MRVCRVETTVSGDGTVTVKNIPFPPGEHVEVVVCARETQERSNGDYPLRGKPIQYVDPFESVAEEDWETRQ
jgi:hypothetical protein